MVRVLYAEDNDDMRDVMRTAMVKFGKHEVQEAKDGGEAFDLFRASPPDIVVTDHNMPVKNGIELVREIRGTGSNVPVILLTARDLDDIEATEPDLSELGIHFVKKPVESIASFNELIRSQVARRSSNTSPSL